MDIGSLTQRLVYKDRIAGVKKAVTDTLKTDSALSAAEELGKSFGRNNRKLLGLR